MPILKHALAAGSRQRVTLEDEVLIIRPQEGDVDPLVAERFYSSPRSGTMGGSPSGFGTTPGRPTRLGGQ